MRTEPKPNARIVRSAAGFCALVALAASAHAHIVLTQPAAASDSTFVAEFRVGHGCDEKPTTRLRIEMPESVSNARPQPKAGWALDVERATGRVAAISWSGRLEADQFDTFAILMKLPKSSGPLYFPTVQTCDGGEERWTDIPAGGQSAHDLGHPAPMLTLTAAAQAGALAVSDVSVPETPGGNGAVYLTIRNAGPADRLTGARSDLAASVELHTMSMDGAVMQMRKVDGLDVPAGGALTFGPDGNHIMLIGLSSPLRAGLTGSLTLIFEHQGEVVVPLTVSPRGGEGGHDHH